MKVSRKSLRRARGVRLLAMDVDGVLTAGDIIVLDSGEEVKFWNVKDRFGFFIARRSGALRFAWITGRRSRQVATRAREMGIEALYQDRHDKAAAFGQLLRKSRLRPEQVAYIGDDWLDLPVLLRAGFSACPADAPEEIREAVDYVTQATGGRGVLREVVEVIMKARGAWEKAVEEFRK